MPATAMYTASDESFTTIKYFQVKGTIDDQDEILVKLNLQFHKYTIYLDTKIITPHVPVRTICTPPNKKNKF